MHHFTKSMPLIILMLSLIPNLAGINNASISVELIIPKLALHYQAVVPAQPAKAFGILF